METDFYPYPLRGGRPACAALHADAEIISIHALREEGDCRGRQDGRGSQPFLSTPSARRATRTSAAASKTLPFLSTPSARRATQRYGDRILWQYISIHALREEGDQGRWITYPMPTNFYPRPPRGGRRTAWMEQNDTEIFLSTPSARRATDALDAEDKANAEISIHALREEGDLAVHGQAAQGRRISIHALREEGDVLGGVSSLINADFYPRPPRGGRQYFLQQGQQAADFYPRPPRGGRRWIFLFLMPGPSYFYPRPPRGGRRTSSSTDHRNQKISIPALREEGDGGAVRLDKAALISIPALREEGDAAQVAGEGLRVLFLSPPSARRATTSTRSMTTSTSYFYPRPPRGGRR